MDVDRHGFEVLDREECLRLLARGGVGRIGLTARALRVILPVNYALLGEDMVVRTSRGTNLAAATARTVVAFEIDEVDPSDLRGWSVLVTGVAQEVSDPDQRRRCDALGLPAWAGAENTCYVRISTEIVTGQRILARAVSKLPGP